MTKNKVMLIILSVIFLVVIWWMFFPNESAEVRSFTYEIEENNDELIFDVHYQFRNSTDNFSYATIVLDSFFYQRIKNPESIEPIFLNGGVSGSTRIIFNKEDLTSDFIESLKTKERNPFRAISIGEEINL
ncbi:hypothetical protein NC661_13610 [Aquibacillus koreensis]|uniref:Uncharacterized protein n=1 Tax=Aquibacillus koreensis TaxID=279446 RepID=A0A9X3WMB2_9BACI|nr:hypothetical protein [Aquibacillus koreensis]MCT2536239.1 hypothetical protein [Aquibacillus koreensis]MDC3421408.1 hypothetical protein [Aquibacillus koreensis]